MQNTAKVDLEKGIPDTLKIDLEKDFLSNVPYLQELAREVEKKSGKDLDSNLIYEVIYADLYLDSLLSKGGEKLPKELTEIHSIFKGIIQTTSFDSYLDSVKNSPTYKKLLKSKYPIEVDAYAKKSYTTYAKGTSPIEVYLKSRRYSIIFTFLIMVAYVWMPSLLPSTASVGTMSGSEIATIHINSVVRLIFSLTSIILISMMTITLFIDLMYIGFPFFREMLSSNEEGLRLVSTKARDCVSSYDSGLDIVVYKPIKNLSRLERNKVWLEEMHRNVNESKTPELAKDISTLFDSVSSIVSKGNTHSKQYYYLMAKVEFLRDEYLNTYN